MGRRIRFRYIPRAITLLLLLVVNMLFPGKAKKVREIKTALGKVAAERAWGPQGCDDGYTHESIVKASGLCHKGASIRRDVKEFIKNAAGRRGTGMSQEEINNLVRKYVTGSYKQDPSKWNERKRQQYKRRVKFLMNVIAHESLMGTASGTDGDGRGYGYGLTQFDPIRHKDISEKEHHRGGMSDVVRRFKRRFGMDPTQWDYDDMNEHEKNVAGAVVAMQPYWRGKMPKNLGGMYNLYDKRWNQGGKATEQKFREDVEKYRGDVNTKPWTKPWPKQKSQNTKRETSRSNNKQRQTYTIPEGGSLSQAGEKFGVPWREIYEANKDKIGQDPNKVSPGTELVIPQDQ